MSNGCFAEYSVVKEAFAVRIPENTPFAQVQ